MTIAWRRAPASGQRIFEEPCGICDTRVSPGRPNPGPRITGFPFGTSKHLRVNASTGRQLTPAGVELRGAHDGENRSDFSAEATAQLHGLGPRCGSMHHDRHLQTRFFRTTMAADTCRGTQPPVGVVCLGAVSPCLGIQMPAEVARGRPARSSVPSRRSGIPGAANHMN